MRQFPIASLVLATAVLAAAPVMAQQSQPSVSRSPGSSHSPLTPSDESASSPDSRSGSLPGATTAAATGDQGGNTASRYITSDDKVRASKIVGASVYNDQNQSIGSVDDVLWDKSGKATTAVVSVGGFLGLGSKLVSVPYDQLKVERDRIVLPGATEASLKGMPDYHYGNA